MFFPLSPWSLLLYYFANPEVSLADWRRNLPPPETPQRPQLRHDAMPLVDKRQDIPLPDAIAAATPTPDPDVLTYVTPSPSATPVAVTSQGQVVESFLPLVTFCALPPLAFVAGSWVNTATTGPYLNYSVLTPSGTGSCETSYIPTQTPVCRTTLTALASLITVSECEQNVTFSSERGYTIETPNATNASAVPSPTVRDLTTYYVASWQDLAATPGAAPSDVDVKVCSIDAAGSEVCRVEYQVWAVQTVLLTTTTTSQVDVTATYPGPGQIIVHTAHWEVTDTITTFSLSSSLEIATAIETESTSSGPRYPSSAPLTQTFTVEYNTNSAALESAVDSATSEIVADSTAEPTVTTTEAVLQTTFVGTSTATITPPVSEGVQP